MISPVMNMLNTQSLVRSITLNMYMKDNDDEIDGHGLSLIFDTIGLRSCIYKASAEFMTIAGGNI